MNKIQINKNKQTNKQTWINTTNKHNRTAFQRGRDQSLRFSLDFNFHVIDESLSPRKKGKNKNKQTWMKIWKEINDDIFSWIIKISFLILVLK